MVARALTNCVRTLTDDLSMCYLPFDVAIKGLASSESAFIATAFLKLFMALPPTLAALAALAVRPGLA